MLEEMIAQLSDEELEQAFHEIVTLREQGGIGEGVLRRVWEEAKEKGFGPSSFFLIQESFLFEMAKRKYTS